MFPALYFFSFSSLVPLLMAAGPQCKPAEQSVSGKALKGHTYKSKRCKTCTNVWCFATTKSHVRTTITSWLVKYASWMRELRKRNLTILSKIKLGFTWESGKTEVGPYQYLNQFTSRRYFKYLRRYRSVTQRATQTTMSVLCRMFEAIHYGIALGPKRWGWPMCNSCRS